MIVDRGTVTAAGLGAPDTAEQLGERQPVVLAGDAQSARLDRQEAGHAFGDGDHIAVIVEDDESGAAQSRSDRFHVFVADRRVKLAGGYQ